MLLCVCFVPAVFETISHWVATGDWLEGIGGADGFGDLQKAIAEIGGDLTADAEQCYTCTTDDLEHAAACSQLLLESGLFPHHDKRLYGDHTRFAIITGLLTQLTLVTPVHVNASVGGSQKPCVFVRVAEDGASLAPNTGGRTTQEYLTSIKHPATGELIYGFRSYKLRQQYDVVVKPGSEVADLLGDGKWAIVMPTPPGMIDSINAKRAQLVSTSSAG